MQVLQGVQSVLTGFIGRYARAVTASNEGSQGPPRLDRRNEVIVQNVWNSIHQLAAEGSLFVAQTATPGTGIVLTSATGTTYSDTQAIFGVNNVDSNPSLNGQGKDHIPLWLKIVITAAGTAGTDDHFAVRLDKGARVSGGTATLTGKCTNPTYPANDDISVIIAGVPTLVAATNNVINAGRAEGRKVAAPAYVAGDVVTFVFGGIEQVQAQAITPATNIGLVLQVPGIVVPPGWSWVLNEWMTARSGAQSAEIEYGYVVK
jgi:hypothetical protein